MGANGPAFISDQVFWRYIWIYKRREYIVQLDKCADVCIYRRYIRLFCHKLRFQWTDFASRYACYWKGMKLSNKTY